MDREEMTEPLISLCMPVYNGMRWLERSVDAAQSCTLPCEIIIVDDGSTDGSREWLKARADSDSRIRLFLNDTDSGLVHNWNRCLAQARGEWIKFLFQDDFWDSGSLELLYACRKERPILVAKRKYVFETNSSSESRQYYTERVQTLDRVAPGKLDFSPVEVSRLIAQRPAINFIGEPSTIMFRRDLMVSLGSFDKRFKQVCDLEYWCRIASIHGISYCPEVSIYFAVHDESQSAKNASRKASSWDPLLLVREQLFGNQFQQFRHNLPVVSKWRLFLWFATHASEEFSKAASAGKEEEFTASFREAPEVIRFGSNKLYYYLTKLARLFLRK